MAARPNGWIRSDFGSWLSTHRMLARIGVRDLGRACGVSSAYISHLETCEWAPPPAEPTIQRIAVALSRDPLEALAAAGCVPDAVLEWVASDPTAWPRCLEAARRGVALSEMVEAWEK